MNKRIRKKHRLKEFTVYGLDLHLDLGMHLDEAQADELCDAMIGFFERLGLGMSGRFHAGMHETNLYITSLGRRQRPVTQAQRDELEYQLTRMVSEGRIVSYQMSGPVDLWWPDGVQPRRIHTPGRMGKAKLNLYPYLLRGLREMREFYAGQAGRKAAYLCLDAL